MNQEEEKHITEVFRELLDNEHFFNKQLDDKINSAVSDASVDRKQHFIINIATVLISLLGVFASYAVFWKESIETNVQIQQAVTVLQERDMPELHKELTNIKEHDEDSEAQLTILSGDLQFSLRTLRELKQELSDVHEDVNELRDELNQHENNITNHNP